MGGNRRSNLEVLRIVSMILIVLHHYCRYGIGAVENPSPDALLVADILGLGGKIGVNAFVLITGYFLSQSRFKVNSLIRIIAEAWFYSLVIGVAFFAYQPDSFAWGDFLKSFLPTRSGLPWFVTAYVGLYLISPFLGRAVGDLSHEAHRKVLVVGALVFSAVPTLTGCMFVTSDLSWFAFLFLVGAYIRKYGINKGCYTKMLWGGSVFLIASTIVLNILSGIYPAIADTTTFFANMYTIPALLTSVGLFCTFKNIKMESVGIVNSVAQGCFGVYLIHENVFMRDFIWGHLGIIFSWGSTFMTIALLLLGACGLFLVCTAIDLIRIRLIEKPFLSLFERKAERMFERVDAYVNIEGMGR